MYLTAQQQPEKQLYGKLGQPKYRSNLGWQSLNAEVKNCRSTHLNFSILNMYFGSLNFGIQTSAFKLWHFSQSFGAEV